MTAYLLTNHLLNFMAPAALLALLLAGLSRLLLFKSKRPFIRKWWAQAAILFVINSVILLAGLLFFGRDGKMLTYAALVLGAAFCQWLMLRAWKA